MSIHNKLLKEWKLLPVEFHLRQQLIAILGISEVTAQTIINRGYTDIDSAKIFLDSPIEYMHDPYLMKDMKKAVQRIRKALDERKSIVIYGDYDVDGITSSALLYLVLKQLDADVQYYIPDRQNEGYGLNQAALQSIYQQGINLVITVDCGISAIDEIASMSGKMDIIITDHHQPPPVLPNAYAILNPHRLDCSYPDKHLAGVGVTYKLCQALWNNSINRPEEIMEYLDLVALGTIADIVPLRGENRIFVKYGLQKIASTQNVGLRSLLQLCNLDSVEINSGKVGFIIAPRLNAAGRVSHARTGVELLVTQDENHARQLAEQLDEENSARQAIEQQILLDVEKKLAGINVNASKVFVVASENWHAGVIGIVASRIVEKYYRPVIIITIDGSIAKGSCRSIPGFNMYEALCECADLLERFGGHPQAAGLTLLSDNIAEFCSRIQDFAARRLDEKDCVPIVSVDSLLSLEDIDQGVIEELSRLAPHGMGNPNPVFACENVTLKRIRKVGKEGKHLKMSFQQKTGSAVDAIAWNMGELAEGLQTDSNLDLLFSLSLNEWHGEKTVQLQTHDLRVAAKGTKREVVAQIYRVLKEQADNDLSILLSDEEIINHIYERFGIMLEVSLVKAGIIVLEELSLLERCDSQGERVLRLMAAPEKKLDIEQSLTFRKGMLLNKGIYSR